ncbi:hypothetical protein C5Y96_12485 [Blastopirellula marina]|uniref:Uncharacterized protein n=1 Tax=Blastopirellula marina TaxID=124 RepID=A0A2S8FG69_9BACT|nr:MULTISPECIES: hypothetical protein [Pirellulaceae]PQO31163.1 hypothetical protein C5Y96_12485 [Blastopirellula marina]RCS51557.1 hypothetical protein DTL36_12495 [Bremerella cremea]
MLRRDQTSRVGNDLVESNAIDRGYLGCLSHLTQGQVLAKQTAIDNGTMRVLAGVPPWYFVRDRLSMVMLRMIVTVVMMSVVVPMILSRYDREMGMARQMRVLATGPGMDYLTE